jgi:hypothetical protein
MKRKIRKTSWRIRKKRRVRKKKKVGQRTRRSRHEEKPGASMPYMFPSKQLRHAY